MRLPYAGGMIRSKHRLVALLIALGLSATVRAETTWHTLPHAGGELEFALVRPAARFTGPRPALLALPPGNQDRQMVEAGLRRYWGEQATGRGWIVVSPVAPEGSSFWSGAESVIPKLLDHVLATEDVDGDRFHIAGASNGGRSAFRIAGLHPERFRSVTVLPGFPPNPEDDDRLPGLVLLPIAMFVGGADERWVTETNATAEQLRKLDADVTVTVLEGEGHVPRSLDGPVMMGHLERMHASSLARDALDAFHAAASAADETAYFGLMTDDAVFVGTDPTERWTKSQFRSYAHPIFAEGRGWTYVPTTRRIVLEASGDVAWFDETLEHSKYGRPRGTGVLRRTDDGWRIAQYVLTFPIPNDLAPEFIERIKANDAVNAQP